MSTSTLSDHDLTTLVDSAAQGVAESAATWHGGTPWAEMDGATKNSIREAALPFIFHGSKALADLGYSKPRIITTHEELDALPDRSIVMDCYGDGHTIYRDNPHINKADYHYIINPGEAATVLHEPVES